MSSIAADAGSLAQERRVPVLALPVKGLFLIFIATVIVGQAVSYQSLFLCHLVAVCLWVVAAVDAYPQVALHRPAITAHRFIFVMWAWYVLSLFWTPVLSYGVVHIMHLTFGIMLLLSVMQYATTVERLRTAVKVIAWVLAIEFFLGLLEMTTPFRMPISLYSEYAGLFGKERSMKGDIIQQAFAAFVDVPTGFNWNPNALAAKVVIAIPFILFYPNIRVRILGLLVVLPLLLTSGARACYVGAVLAIVIWLLGFSVRRLVIGGVVFVMLLIGVNRVLDQLEASGDNRVQQTMVLGEAIQAYVQAEGAGRPGSVGIRATLMDNGAKALVTSGYLGVGAGGGWYVQEPTLEITRGIRGMHNWWLEIILDGGLLLGVSMFVWYVWTGLRLYIVGLNSRVPTIRYLASSLAAAMGGFSVALISLSSALPYLSMWLMLGLAFSVLNVNARVEADEINGNGGMVGTPA